jgi:hypothetical protein
MHETVPINSLAQHTCCAACALHRSGARSRRSAHRKRDRCSRPAAACRDGKRCRPASCPPALGSRIPEVLTRNPGTGQDGRQTVPVCLRPEQSETEVHDLTLPHRLFKASSSCNELPHYTIKQDKLKPFQVLPCNS